jgi:hypothetical protein
VASQVCTPLPEHRTSPGLHTPVHAPFTQAWLVQAVPAAHAPLALQVCTMPPLQRVAPVLHCTHAPPEQTGTPPVQAVGEPHWPNAVQLSTLPPGPASPVHWVAPGVQTPEHAPPVHTYVQLAAVPHWPLDVHVCTPLPEHCVVPGEQAPPHTPALQTLGQGEPVSCQVPVASQVWGCWPLHCSAPGAHEPVQAPALHT